MTLVNKQNLSELSISALEGFGFSAGDLKLWLSFLCGEESVYLIIEGLLLFDVSSDSYEEEISDTNIVEFKHDIRSLNDSEWNKYSYRVDDKDRNQVFNIISIYGDLTIQIICKGYSIK